MSDRGGRPRSVSDEEILEVFRESDEYVLTTAEVADELGVSRRTALRRLSGLADEGTVERKNVGDRSAVWWLPDEAPPSDPVPDDDPFLTARTFSSGRTDVSESVDETVADALRSGTDDE